MTRRTTSSLNYFCKKDPKLFRNTTRRPASSLNSFCKKDPKLFRNTTRHPSLIGLACHSLRRPQWAEFGPMLVCLIYYSFPITNKFAQTFEIAQRITENIVNRKLNCFEILMNISMSWIHNKVYFTIIVLTVHICLYF